MPQTEESWALVFDTNVFTASFAREAGAYIVGYANELTTGPYLNLFRQDYNLTESQAGPFQYLWDISYTEIGPDIAYPWITPHWFDDGQGHILHEDSDEGRVVPLENRIPIYHSVTIQLTEQPSPEKLEELAVRVKQFAEIYNDELAEYAETLVLSLIRLVRSTAIWADEVVIVP